MFPALLSETPCSTKCTEHFWLCLLEQVRCRGSKPEEQKDILEVLTSGLIREPRIHRSRHVSGMHPVAHLHPKGVEFLHARIVAWESLAAARLGEPAVEPDQAGGLRLGELTLPADPEGVCGAGPPSWARGVPGKGCALAEKGPGLYVFPK